MRHIIIAIALLLCGSLQALSFIGNSRCAVNGEQMDLGIFANKRTPGNIFVPMEFSQSTASYPDSTVILYDAPEIAISVNVSSREQYEVPAFLFKVRAIFKQEVYIHELYLSLNGVVNEVSALLKGVGAIQSGSYLDNKNIMPYTDKAAEFICGDSRFWVVASNYDECGGIEGISENRVTLYDYRGHFFRSYVNAVTPQLRDCLYLPIGKEASWGFLLFEEMPTLLEINRWLGNKAAALCITNDADMEDVPRLMSAYYGSNNPANPKYLTQGFFAHNIPVTNTVFGANQPILDNLWTSIMEHGNAIGYHTYSSTADDMSLLEQSLLYNMNKYNVRTWIDHVMSQNPEDIAYNGADPNSPQYTLNIFNECNIDYVWPHEGPPTNPFNAYEEAWRLPHLVYELSGLTKPLWLYGRTRMEAWEYHNSATTMVSFKYMMTADNLDKLIADKGLHISYTHFCSSNVLSYSSFWTLDTNGDYIIRDDVEEMLQMLEFYREHRNLWIATSEDIFDRMLDIEKVKVVSVQKSKNLHRKNITIKNGSSRNIEQLNLVYGNEHILIPELAAGEFRTLAISDDGSPDGYKPQVLVSYANGALTLKDRDNLGLSPLTVDIFNIRGQKVLSQKLNVYSDSMQIPFQNKATGIYIARVRSDYKSYGISRFCLVK
ncbi:MAG: hypothetical protein KA984_03980 [Candidatus Cloacimonetes bacterium]|nr:hypothetical protein [Candidatus Cloacimonadota bacterium]